MIKLVDITFHANTEFADTSAMLESQAASLLYVNEISSSVDIEVIKHIHNPATVIQQHPHYRFFKGRNHFFTIPVRSLLYLRRKRPDIVLVQGLIFPVQLLAMKYALGRKVKIMVKHHAEMPAKGIKRSFQKHASKYIDAFLFSSIENATEWVSAGIVDKDKIYTLPATYTSFSHADKQQARLQLGWGNGLHYIWVGRLNGNKDPMTVLAAFKKYLAVFPGATLHVLYKTGELLPEVESVINSDTHLSQAVRLHGWVPNTALQAWYSAADFYISSSYAEGGSVALMEAMACGCIPIVSNIPSSMKTIGDGKNGLYFTAGDVNGLYDRLLFSQQVPGDAYSKQVVAAFQEGFSLPVITRRLIVICQSLVNSRDKRNIYGNR